MPRYISRITLDKALDEGSYLNRLPAVRHLAQVDGLDFVAPVTFFVGENGTGKSVTN